MFDDEDVELGCSWKGKSRSEGKSEGGIRVRELFFF
jgi:hypothetical protein